MCPSYSHNNTFVRHRVCRLCHCRAHRSLCSGLNRLVFFLFWSKEQMLSRVCQLLTALCRLQGAYPASEDTEKTKFKKKKPTPAFRTIMKINRCTESVVDWFFPVLKALGAAHLEVLHTWDLTTHRSWKQEDGEFHSCLAGGPYL